MSDPTSPNTSPNDPATSRISRRDALKTVAALATLPMLPIDASSREPAPRATVDPTGARRESFDAGWRFFRGDAAGAEKIDVDDRGWRELDLPHDWSIEDLPERRETTGESAMWTTTALPSRMGPFDASASEGQSSTGFVVGGTGWYRKHFSGKKIPVGQLVAIVFDGVYMDSDVWLNGEHVGAHPYGYTGFAVDLTAHLRRDGDNVLAVRVRNVGKNSRWYSGSGIYRRVWLDVSSNVRIPLWGLSVTTPEVAPSSASVRVSATVENRSAAARSVDVVLRVLDSAGAVVATGTEHASVPADGSVDVVRSFPISSPKLWSPATPILYVADAAVSASGASVDSASTSFGIRAIEVDAERGLRINGEPIKLKGGCMHHDNGVLGSAAIDRAEERRVELMKANGFNAIRTSHNPPSPAFLDACDRVGIVVIDEAFDMWHEPKNPQDYSRFFDEWSERDVQTMVRRDRNHPSVVFWSIGNEIHERAEPAGVAIAERLVKAIKAVDATRPITAAICHFWDYPGREWSATAPAFTHLDVGGYNYKWNEYGPDHQAFPTRVMMGTESFPFEAFENWQAVEDNAYVLGDFVWTGMDYLGETGIGSPYLDKQVSYGLQPYPWFNAFCGDVDLIGGKKPQSYFRDVVWRRSPLEMAVQRPVPEGHKETISAWGWSDELRSWTWPGSEGKTLRVRVYTRGDSVRLSLNGKEIGTVPVSAATKLTAEFEVPYEPGELRAVASLGGKEIGTQALATVGPPAAVRLSADRAEIRDDRNDLSFVTAEIVDAKGNVVPDATIPVTFALDGSAELAGVGSADPRDISSFRNPTRKTFQGRCLAVVRPTGGETAVTLRASARGVANGSVAIRVRGSR